jgi:hypothetical protein
MGMTIGELARRAQRRYTGNMYVAQFSRSRLLCRRLQTKKKKVENWKKGV